jgi:ribosome-binding protein aMBF1 (putative translation factor)
MSDLKKYINNRKKTDKEFANNFDSGYENFKIGIMLKQAREESGFTQEQLAERLQTKKSAISRIENHAEDIRLSTLEKYAKALNFKLNVSLQSN